MARLSNTSGLALSCLLACVVALWSTRKYYCCICFATLYRAELKAVLLCLRYVDVLLLWLSELLACMGFLVFRRRKKQVRKQKLRCLCSLEDIFLAELMMRFVSKNTSPAVMFTSRLILLSAMTRTEKSACVAKLPRSHKHTRARFLLLLLWCCCNNAGGCGAATYYLLLCLVASSSLVTRKKKKEKEKNVTKSKESKELREGSPRNHFLVGNYGLRRAERWEDTPSMSSEVGEI